MERHKNKAYNLRLDEETMTKIRAIAEREDRPLSKQFERIIKSYLEEYEKQNGSVNIDIHHNHIAGDLNVGK